MRSHRIAIVATAFALVAGISTDASAASRPAHSPLIAGGGLTFGIYPGGSSRSAAAQDAPKTFAALDELQARGDPLLLHIYSGYTGQLPWSYYRYVLATDVVLFEREGFDVELVLRYAPIKDGGSERDVRGFVVLVRRIVALFGSNRHFVSVQITNEADRSTTAASDGHFKYARDALIDGVIAAKATASTDHFGQLRVGFNYGAMNPAFWRYLGAHGGPQFRKAVDWVGIDAYPGSLSPLPGNDLQAGVSEAIAGAIYTARARYLPLARIPAQTALHFSENGYATADGHTYAMQATAIRSAVETVAFLSGIDRVTEYNLFDLRDTSSSSNSVQSRFGLLQANYTPKPAFDAYRALIKSGGLPPAGWLFGL